MKKILFGILTFLGIGLSFCSAFICDNIDTNGHDCRSDPNDSGCIMWFGCDGCFSSTNSWYDCYEQGGTQDGLDCVSTYNYILNSCTTFWSNIIYGGGSSTGNCEDKDIIVFYNSGSSTSITCDGTQAIQINGLSTITSTNTFTPYYDIFYTDEDNQKLTESYSKSNLYLSGGLFKKTYTGDNERILTDTIESPNSSFSGYLPTFEITGGIEEVTESGNIFNNFAENSLKFTLSNIPSYIQYVILLFILFFILGFIRKFRRK